MRYAVWICAFLGLSGCSVSGFRTVPDGLTTPTQLREGAAVARAEATALDDLADIQESTIRRIAANAGQVADTIGAPAIVSGLIGAGAGFMVPTPGQRRRTQQAKAEGRLEARR